MATTYKNSQCAPTSGTSFSAALLAGILHARNAPPVPSGSISCCSRTDSVANVSNLANLRFDVKIELDAIRVSKVGDIDGTEDLYGNIKYLAYRSSISTINSSSATLWQRLSSAPQSLGVGTHPVDAAAVPITAF
jgi:hypothetical protein